MLIDTHNELRNECKNENGNNKCKRKVFMNDFPCKGGGSGGVQGPG